MRDGKDQSPNGQTSGNPSLMYGTNLQQCYMDTASFVYNIEMDDMSDYSCSRPLPMGVNMKVIGLMKNGLGGRIMTKFMALRPKLYIYKTLSGSRSKKCKGAKKSMVKKMLDLDDYKQCLLAGQNIFRKQLMFQNRLHKVHMIEVNKVALNRDNDK